MELLFTSPRAEPILYINMISYQELETETFFSPTSLVRRTEEVMFLSISKLFCSLTYARHILSAVAKYVQMKLSISILVALTLDAKHLRHIDTYTWDWVTESLMLAQRNKHQAVEVHFTVIHKKIYPWGHRPSYSTHHTHHQFRRLDHWTPLTLSIKRAPTHHSSTASAGSRSNVIYLWSLPHLYICEFHSFSIYF